MNAPMQQNAQQSAQEIGVMLHGRTLNSSVSRMVKAGSAWVVQQQSPRKVPVAQAIRHLSATEHNALKENMLAAAEDYLAQQSDLDRAIAYLQALGQLARAEDDKTTAISGQTRNF